MLIREFAPSPALAPFVQLIWCLELDSAADFGPPERVTPDGILELVLHYRRPLPVGFAGEPMRRQPRSSLVSQTHRYLEMAPRVLTVVSRARIDLAGLSSTPCARLL